MATLSVPTSSPLSPEAQQAADIALVLQSAIEQHQQGAFDDAQALYEAILGALPEQPQAHYGLAMLKVRTGAPADALPHFEIALGSAPNDESYWFGYINALIEAGMIAAGWTAVNLAQQRGVGGQTLNLLMLRLSNSVEGTPSPMRFTLSTPLDLPSMPDTAEASASEPAASVRRPNPQDMNRLATLYNKGRDEDAIKLARTLTRRFPAHGPAWRVLGLALHRSGQTEPAREAFVRTLTLLPDDTQCRLLLADGLRLLNQFADAERQCRQIFELAPDMPEANRLMCTLLGGLGRVDEARTYGLRAIELAPNNESMYSSLAVMLFDHNGSPTEAEPYFRRACELNPSDAGAHSSLLFSLTHQINIDVAALAAEHRGFAARHEAPLRARWTPHPNRRDPARPLRIGFVSGDLFKHAVASYLTPLLGPLKREGDLSLYFYYNHVLTDYVTAGLKGHASAWRDVSTLSDDKLCRQIRDDRIDILVDLSGHTGRNRLLTFARKPAPVQVSFIGYPGTTGLDAMDYYFADRFAIPPGPVEQQFSEKIVRLQAAAAFEPERQAPPVNLLPARHNGYVTFGSFNRLNKLRADVIAVWARLLHALPNARMVLGGIPPEGGQDELVGWFEQAGIGRERLDFLTRSATIVYLQQHHQIDICLDTFPYNGSTTVLHSLWMGVPTLTIEGDTLPSRSGATWMSHVGLDAFIAADADDFVAKGVAAARDVDTLARVRGELRSRCQASPAFQPEVVGRNIADAFRTMWRRWCDELPPESFSVTPRPELDGESK
ncbi:tetratricopeptide repeat protein [Burkholderia sp. FERM BP-3421]|jgi:predicted O-linked N-acetylglucosamine transferase (SPINDLY family)|uniref:tetratricopeptide repeat protein n=1 Tax=Burkholderia sp. FERM BP-3421 TaxID=1494466 RepID=UPI00235FC180|nr:tetratricopeptide repeat protein [Burkholderia sp. FERM BP-3421]WDD95953.1 tetratricopeptide repeat protein [Burkholderia sp. FERM BP-3421]